MGILFPCFILGYVVLTYFREWGWFTVRLKEFVDNFFRKK